MLIVLLWPWAVTGGARLASHLATVCWVAVACGQPREVASHSVFSTSASPPHTLDPAGGSNPQSVGWLEVLVSGHLGLVTLS